MTNGERSLQAQAANASASVPNCPPRTREKGSTRNPQAPPTPHKGQNVLGPHSPRTSQNLPKPPRSDIASRKRARKISATVRERTEQGSDIARKPDQPGHRQARTRQERNQPTPRLRTAECGTTPVQRGQSSKSGNLKRGMGGKLTRQNRQSRLRVAGQKSQVEERSCGTQEARDIAPTREPPRKCKAGERAWRATV